MTTTITVETHGWPVAVTTSSEHNHVDDHNRSHGYQESTVFVPKGEKQMFHISSTSQLSVRELPADATGLGSNDPLPDAIGAAAGTLVTDA